MRNAGKFEWHLISQPRSGWQPLQTVELAEENAWRSRTTTSRRKKISHEIGQDLSLLSVEELAERIALLNAEIERLQAAMTKKRASKDAANSFFKS